MKLDERPAYPIELTAEEARHLQHLVRAHTTAQTLAVRARIILTAHAHPDHNKMNTAPTPAFLLPAKR